MSNAEVYSTWTLIQDIIGDCHRWPRKIRRVFWKKEAKHWERIMIATFAFVNGLAPSLLEHWLGIVNFPTQRKVHIMYLVHKYEENPRCYRLYAWNVTMQRNEWLDGRPARTGRHL